MARRDLRMIAQRFTMDVPDVSHAWSTRYYQQAGRR